MISRRCLLGMIACCAQVFISVAKFLAKATNTIAMATGHMLRQGRANGSSISRHKSFSKPSQGAVLRFEANAKIETNNGGK